MKSSIVIIALIAIAFSISAITVRPYEVYELDFAGKHMSAQDKPTDISFFTIWKHASGAPEYKIHGFWYGDKVGMTSGNVFKVRFCPTETGVWTLTRTSSSDSELNGQHEGTTVTCQGTPANPGFWWPDPGKKWLRRSDGTYQYFIGNVHYSWLLTNNHVKNINLTKDYFKKVRFYCITDLFKADIPMCYDANGAYSNCGGSNAQDASRPNPAWFKRIDEAVFEAAKYDMVMDLYLERQNKAIFNDNYLRYMAARFGAFPNVWMQLGIEWNEFMTAQKTASIGEKVRSYLPYPTPLSCVSTADWDSNLNSKAWTHANIQGKKMGLCLTRDNVLLNEKRAGGKFANFDDGGLSYEGAQASTEHVMEYNLGAFMGGSYNCAAFMEKKGKYVEALWHGGLFDPSKHAGTKHHKFMREIADTYIYFWEMKPGTGNNLFNVPGASSCTHAVIGWDKKQYAFGSNAAKSGIKANLPSGTYRVQQFNILQNDTRLLAAEASGTYVFSTPDSRACITLFTNTQLPRKHEINPSHANTSRQSKSHAVSFSVHRNAIRATGIVKGELFEVQIFDALARKIASCAIRKNGLCTLQNAIIPGVAFIQIVSWSKKDHSGQPIIKKCMRMP